MRLARPAAFLFFIVILYIAVHHLTGYGLPCLFHLITGLYCPGCGTGRMFFAILRLDFSSAFRANPYVFILIPIFSIYYIAEIRAYLKGQSRKASRSEYISLFFILAGLIIFGVLRNIPYFSFLAPST
ncbi:MAG: DUF2752 domain-containing protein [Clostridiaceae bacterium]|nr:DUF2752 domain-containing protein [Clostridiaceae bacterium]